MVSPCVVWLIPINGGILSRKSAPYGALSLAGRNAEGGVDGEDDARSAPVGFEFANGGLLAVTSLFQRELEFDGDVFLLGVIAIEAHYHGEFGGVEHSAELIDGIFGLGDGKGMHAVEQAGVSLSDAGIRAFLVGVEAVFDMVSLKKLFAVAALT